MEKITNFVTTEKCYDGVGDLIAFQLKSQVFRSCAEKQSFLLPMVVLGRLHFFVIPPSPDEELLAYSIQSSSSIPEVLLKKAPFVKDLEIMAQIQTFVEEYNLCFCPKLCEIFCSSFSNIELVKERLMPDFGNAQVH